MPRKKWKPTPEDLVKVEKWAMMGLSKEALATNLGIASSTFYKYVKINRKFDAALKRGRALGVVKAAVALMKLIEQGNLKAIMYYLRVHGGWNDKPVKKDPEMGSMIEAFRDAREAQMKKAARTRPNQEDFDCTVSVYPNMNPNGIVSITAEKEKLR